LAHIACVCFCTHMCTSCKKWHIYIYICIHICIYTYIYIYVYIYIYTHECTFIFVYMYLRTYEYIYTIMCMLAGKRWRTWHDLPFPLCAWQRERDCLDLVPPPSPLFFPLSLSLCLFPCDMTSLGTLYNMYMLVFVYVCVCVCVCVCICIYKYTYMYMYTHIHKLICIYILVYTCRKASAREVTWLFFERE